ncbi:hypothetical protein SeMB42_g02025 [Synchytrium endobioticum]|uniref:RNA helicase n=1 Tax=Synchytrium endobioticum TaxID=286115 RepID=A0A507DIU5_9FUNG|nr:hypothetical protein SeMB42_g02025 [Synchytrium endobioticum]
MRNKGALHGSKHQAAVSPSSQLQRALASTTPPVPHKEMPTNPSDALPIEAYVPEILDRVRHNQVTILVGETGSGKSTIVPQVLAEDSIARNIKPRVLCSQPRRVAAQKLAKRVNETYGARIGNEKFAGYRVMNERDDADSPVVYATTGYLIQWLRYREDVLDKVTHLILDESHERTIDMDLLSLLIKRHLHRKGPSHPVRLIIMSATMDTGLYKKYFTLHDVEPLDHIYVGANRFQVEDCYLEDLVGVNPVKVWVDDEESPQNAPLEPADKSTSNDSSNNGANSHPSTSAFQLSSPVPRKTKLVTEYVYHGEWDYKDFWRSIEGLEEWRRFIGESVQVFDAMDRFFGPKPSIDESFYEIGVYLALWLCQMHDVATWQVAYAQGQPSIDNINAHDDADGVDDPDARTRFNIGPCIDPDEAEFMDEMSIKPIARHQEFIEDDDPPYPLPHAQNDPSQSTCILIFLPGEHEQLSWYEMYRDIMAFQKPHVQAIAKRNISIHMLHSKANQDEVEAAFRVGPPGSCRIILATNIAESSVTIPDVKYVIDYGLRRAMEYNSRRGTQQLALGFISRASRTQRRGRAGRCSAGKIFSLYTSQFSESCLREHEIPEISQCSLESIILRVRQIFPNDAAKIVLNEMVEPPELSQVENALKRLAQVGALLKPAVLADHFTEVEKEGCITYLGAMAAELPITIVESRVLLIGAAMGEHLSAVVLAAALNGPDIFSMPSANFERDQAKFVSMLAASFAGRMYADDGSMSEPIAVLRVFGSWLQHEDAIRPNFLQEICVNWKRFREFRLGVKTLANALARSMESKMEKLESIRNSHVNISSVTPAQLEKGYRTIEQLRLLAAVAMPEQRDPLERDACYFNVQELFPATDHLRVILVMACAPQILYGVAPKPDANIALANQVVTRAFREAQAALTAESEDMNAPQMPDTGPDDTDNGIKRNCRKDRQTERRRAKIEEAKQRAQLTDQWLEHHHQARLGQDPRLQYFYHYVHPIDQARYFSPPSGYPDLGDGLGGRYSRLDPYKCLILDLKRPTEKKWIGVTRAVHLPGRPGHPGWDDTPDKIVLEFMDGPRPYLQDASGYPLHPALQSLTTENLSFRLAVYDVDSEDANGRTVSTHGSILGAPRVPEAVSLDIARLLYFLTLARSTTGMGSRGNRIALSGSTVFLADLVWHLRLVALSALPHSVTVQLNVPCDSTAKNDFSVGTAPASEKLAARITGISHEFAQFLMELSPQACPEAFLEGSYMLQQDLQYLNRPRRALARTLLTGEGLITGSLKDPWMYDLERLAMIIRQRFDKAEGDRTEYFTAMMDVWDGNLGKSSDRHMEIKRKILWSMACAAMGGGAVGHDSMGVSSHTEGTSSNGNAREYPVNVDGVYLNEEEAALPAELHRALDLNGIRIEDKDDYDAEMMFPSFISPRQNCPKSRANGMFDVPEHDAEFADDDDEFWDGPKAGK